MTRLTPETGNLSLAREHEEVSGNSRHSRQGVNPRRSGLAKADSGRLAVSPAEAAYALGVSRDFFDAHVLPELRVVRRGRLILVSIRELEAWLERSAERTLPEAWISFTESSN
jgi:hypothetical protein